MTRVKICGITELEDARDAALLGADAIGLNFYPNSPRYIDPARASKIIEKLPPFVTTVGVFVNHPDPQSLEDFAISLGLHAVQLHGQPIHRVPHPACQEITVLSWYLGGLTRRCY